MGNREDLLDGAMRCLRERGWARTTVRDIAAAAGVSHAAIGYHFGTREALLEQAMATAMAEWGEQIGRAVEGAAGAPDPYAALWDGLVASVTDRRDLSMATVDALVRSDHQESLRAVLARGHEQARRGLAAVLLGVAPEEVSDEDARTLGAVQLALVSGVTVQWLASPEGAPTAAEVVAGLRTLARLVTAPVDTRTVGPRESDAAAAGSELPARLGRPARRALAVHGFTRWAQLTRVTPADLLALHGVGPKAVRILTEELAQRGLAFAAAPSRPRTARRAGPGSGPARGGVDQAATMTSSTMPSSS